MQVMIVRPGVAVPEITEIDNSLGQYQSIVGGPVETYKIASGIAILFHEEGNLKGLPANRIVMIGNFFGVIRGTILICGSRLTAEGAEFCGLEGEALEKMREMWTGNIFLAQLPENL